MQQETHINSDDPISKPLALLKQRLSELHGGFDEHVNAIIVEKANELLEKVLDRIAFDEHEYQLLIKAVNRTYNYDSGEYIHPLTGKPYDPSDIEMQNFIYRWWHGAYDNEPSDEAAINPDTGEIVGFDEPEQRMAIDTITNGKTRLVKVTDNFPKRSTNKRA